LLVPVTDRFPPRTWPSAQSLFFPIFWLSPILSLAVSSFTPPSPPSSPLHDDPLTRTAPPPTSSSSHCHLLSLWCLYNCFGPGPLLCFSPMLCFNCMTHAGLLGFRIPASNSFGFFPTHWWSIFLASPPCMFVCALLPHFLLSFTFR